MIVVFGSINVDLVAHVARLPHPGETVTADSFASHPGGKGANQALAARRAGAEVALIGAVGNDGFAAAALQSLEDAAVDLTRVRRVDAPTGIALIHVESSGENCITIVAGANASADAAQVPDELLAVDTTVVMQLEVPLPAVCALAARAHQRGARTILNAAPSHALPADLLESLDALIVNETEATAIAAALPAPALPEDVRRRPASPLRLHDDRDARCSRRPDGGRRHTGPRHSTSRARRRYDGCRRCVHRCLRRRARPRRHVAAGARRGRCGRVPCLLGRGRAGGIAGRRDIARLAATVEARLLFHALG